MQGTSLLKVGMFVASEILVFIIPLGLVAGWLAGNQEDAVVAFTVVLIGLTISYAFGFVYQQPIHSQASEMMIAKPPENSFPSQHTTVMATFTWTLAGLQYRRTAGIVFVLTVLVGIGRVFVGHHYPIDIAGGILASLVGVAFAYLLMPYIQRVGAGAAAIDNHVRDALLPL